MYNVCNNGKIIKLRLLFTFCVIILLFSGCNNVWMEDILQPKTITFESNGGSYVESQIIYKNEKISEPQTPSMVGYTFEGWYTDNIYFTARWDFERTPKKDMTLYAKWLLNSNNHPHEPFNSIDKLETYLQSLPQSNTPYDIELDIDNLEDIAKIIKKYPNILINLILTSNNINNIEQFYFSNCNNLVSVVLPNSVTSIDDFSFSSCPNLTSVTIGNNVTKINVNAFYNCTSLTEITIPESITFIGECAFLDCDSLISVTFEGMIYYDDLKTHAFPGDLQEKFYKNNKNYGTPGTYTRPDSASQTWTKQ
ncbi:leucine-rich repeat protein [Treponema sp. R6D11]